MYRGADEMIAEMLGVFIVIILIFAIPTIGQWKTFEKAGQPGWAAIIPIYATVMVVQVSKKPMWWVAVILLAGIIPFFGGLVALV